MTKGQRRAGTQTLHISSSPISLCTSQDLLGREEGVRGEGGAKRERMRDKKRENQKRRRESYLLSVLYTQELLFWHESKWGKNKWQRGDKVNKKMACKITRRYSVRKKKGGKEESSAWTFPILSNLTLHMLKPHFQGLICHMVCPVLMIYWVRKSTLIIFFTAFPCIGNPQRQ